MPPPRAFDTFFAKSFADGRHPYDYQRRLACGDREQGQSEAAWLQQSAPCVSRLISIPTGLGKTAAVILAWLWNRQQKDSTWPGRLVFCLPMRTLVEQTRDECRRWLLRLARTYTKPRDGSELRWLALHSPLVLMGGEELSRARKEWDLYPEKPAIIIGTQDMLLSRALNRGYGMSRYRWPMHFGLLNNDCLWVMDETQLMGVGVETSAQLDGFRHLAGMLPFGPCPTWWMSATLEDSRLATVDHQAPAAGWPRLTLGLKDRELVRHRLDAAKRLQKAGLVLSKQLKPDQHAKEFAKLVLEKHVPETLTLVIVNRVARAQELYQALRKAGRTENLGLVHSRFRSGDRKKHQDLLIEGTGDRIVVATQAVEAGVDVSARVLITELAPWSSLVQRFGRCNRGGEFNDQIADIHWIDLNFEKEDDVAPYTLEELRDARVELEKLEGQSVSPQALVPIHVPGCVVIRPVIRRKDLIDLFDTTPDIAGHDLDISRYIREGEDTDVQVFWRDLSATDFEPTKDDDEPSRVELCRVAVHQFKAFLEKLKKAGDGRHAYVWDGLRNEWRVETKARPGAVYMLDHRAGGYDADLGWIGDLAGLKKVENWPLPIPSKNGRLPDATTRDPLTLTGAPLSLSLHTAHVVNELGLLLENLNKALKPLSPWHEPLHTAALWHDVGKSHPAFQQMLRAAAGDNAPEGLLAKSGRKGATFADKWRKHFRHELASALAWLANNEGGHEADLIAYVIAAHHGKVRLSIRSMPEETPPKEMADSLMARGIVDGEKLDEVVIEGLTMPATTLSLDLMRMGSDSKGLPSWLARMIALRDRIGPFALAYLETLLRAADMRASALETIERG